MFTLCLIVLYFSMTSGIRLANPLSRISENTFRSNEKLNAEVSDNNFTEVPSEWMHISSVALISVNIVSDQIVCPIKSVVYVVANR